MYHFKDKFKHKFTLNAFNDMLASLKALFNNVSL